LDKKAKEQQFQKTSRKNVNIPQLVQELEVKLAKGKVECMICYDMVEGICSYGVVQIFFQFFHLLCIQNWVHLPTS
jgi:transcriptional repressor NF-X1